MGLDSRFHGNDDTWDVDFFIALLIQDTSGTVPFPNP